MKIKWFFETGLLIILSFFVAVLPHKIALKAGEIFGMMVFYVFTRKRKTAFDNIERLLIKRQTKEGRSRESELLVKEVFKNIGKSFVEIIKIYYGFGKKILKKIEIIGLENYHKAQSKGRGVIFITGHCGNWELMALSVGLKTNGVSVVAREQKNPFFNRLIEHIRAKYGNRIIYKKGALKAIISELRQAKNVGILMDQAVFKNEGYIIDFLGRPSGTLKTPALIARKTGAPVIPVFINRYDKGHIINIYPEVKLSENADSEKALVEDTARFMGFIEAYIKGHPTEWYWIHRKWKDRLNRVRQWGYRE